MANENLKRALEGVRKSKHVGGLAKLDNEYADRRAHERGYGEHERELDYGKPGVPWSFMGGVKYNKGRDSNGNERGIARGKDRDERIRSANKSAAIANRIVYRTIAHQNLKKALKGKSDVTR